MKLNSLIGDSDKTTEEKRKILGVFHDQNSNYENSFKTLKGNLDTANKVLVSTLTEAQGRKEGKTSKKTAPEAFQKLIKKIEEFKKLKHVSKIVLPEINSLKETFDDKLTFSARFAKIQFKKIKELNKNYGKKEVGLSNEAIDQLQHYFSSAKSYIDHIIKKFKEMSENLSKPEVAVANKSNKIIELDNILTDNTGKYEEIIIVIEKILQNP